MRLANDEIVVVLPSGTIRLRPTLRAAFRLERDYGGFQKLSENIAAWRLSTITDVIRLGAVNPTAAELMIAYETLEAIEALREPLLRFVMLLAGVDDNQSGTKATRTPMSYDQYFSKLFRLATGWLGWTPDQAWNATPAEITEAYNGRMEMLSAIFGNGKETDDNTVTDISSARDRLNALGDQAVHSMAEVPL
ncbi:phage tail assembly chaperone [Bradyrhizobium sp. WSM 1704]|uniref:phage tail assembly chaperone n=1 Tax=Bradyrhizobium semiaridum TaxID=2821404 RepID=UPI001CE27529|nr:phage tail assembly chaperone [Bradyrhizobium semiaridum]MCA6124560.1 phage tail assembly chaperone [Bradyrhizobium semiaridum]